MSCLTGLTVVKGMFTPTVRIILPHRVLRWLQPPDGEKWIGFHEGLEVALVWPEGMRGNHLAVWRWQLIARKASGQVDGTENEVRDRLAAQSAAENEYFERH